MEVFESPFGTELRAEKQDGEWFFCLQDIGYGIGVINSGQINSRLNQSGVRKISAKDRKGTMHKLLFVNEFNMMKAILKTKDKDHDDFYFWIVREVLPVLKNEDQVKLPDNIEQKIKLLAQGDVLLSERVGKIETKLEILEDELPLFAYDIEEIQEHAVRHIKQLLGEKYKDNSLRAKTYINLYKKIEEEFNVYCYKGLARKKLADVHEFIDCYKGVEYEERK